jgi:hypothetical protein
MEFNVFNHCDDWATFTCNEASEEYFYVKNPSPYDNPHKVATDRQLFVKYNFQLDENKVIRERTAYNLLNLISDVGGIFGTIVPFGAFINGVFAGILANVSLASGMFWIAGESDEPEEGPKKRKLDQNLKWLKSSRRLNLSLCDKFI